MKYLFIASLFLIGCASIQPLSGGDKDTTAPVITSTSVDSAATNVTTAVFEFNFDEYIQQKQALENLLISPNQSVPPTITVKKRRLTIELNDSLIPNTTYTFQFNGAIADINEGNPVNNYNYIFSTGDYIDSAYYDGFVINYLDKTPCSECNVHLYKSYSDTTLLKHKPAYLARTNKSGRFIFNNLPSQRFYAIAIHDKNKNYFYDKEELISLPQIRHSDTTSIDTLSVFPNQNMDDYKVTLESTKVPGVYSFISNKAITTDTIKLLFNGKEIPFQLSFNKDSIKSIYRQNSDTLAIELHVGKDTFTYTSVLNLSKLKYNVKPSIKQHAGNIQIKSTTPITEIDTSKIFLQIDSVKSPIKIVRIDTFSLSINTAANYKTAQLILLQNSLTDLYNQTNKGDTLNTIKTTEDPTTLSLDIKGDSSSTYILIITTNKSEVVKTQFSGSKKLTYSDLRAGTYKATLYTDINNNGVWDTGNVFTGKVPEPITITEEFEIRENWDKELIINL